MKKLLGLFARKPSMSEADFRKYYEHRHVGLCIDLFPRYSDYRRSYIDGPYQLAGSYLVEPSRRPQFDVILEAWFADQAFESLEKDLHVASIGEAIAADEANFFDRETMVVHNIEDRVTEDEDLGRSMDAANDGSMLKVVALARRKNGMGRLEFIDQIERQHVPLVARLLPTLARYRRCYPIENSGVQFAHFDDIPPAPDFDVMFEMWFQNKSDQDKFAAAMADPGIAGRITESESLAIDRRTMRLLSVDERVTPNDKLRSAAVRKGYTPYGFEWPELECAPPDADRRTAVE